MNNANFIGRLTRDPIAYHLEGGRTIIRFTLAINRFHKKSDGPKKNEADFIPCIAWNKQAEIILKFCRKGTRIGVFGPMRSSTYVDNDGNRHYTLDCNVNHINLLGDKNDHQQSQPPTNDNFNSIDIPF